MQIQLVQSIANVLKTSDFSDYNLRSIDFHQSQFYVDVETEKILRNDSIQMNTSFRDNKSKVSDSWIAGNLLIFTMFDGWLEYKYNLQEGTSFKKRYDFLAAQMGSNPTDLQIIETCCYRIIKLIRNAIQHNLSSVSYDEKQGYIIAYTNQRTNTNFLLEITAESIIYLYSLIMALVDGTVRGIPMQYITSGFTQGIMAQYYDKMINGILVLEDDISDPIIPIERNLIRIKDGRRYIITEPYIVEETEESIIFHWLACLETWEGADYKYEESGKTYFLPEEIGEILLKEDAESDQDIISNSSIKFKRMDINDKWRVKEVIIKGLGYCGDMV